jgi:hypothetical protein
MGILPFSKLHLSRAPLCVLHLDFMSWCKRPSGLPLLDTVSTCLLPFYVRCLGLMPFGMLPLDITS